MRYPDWILERSFGGIGAAVGPYSPSTEAGWPVGEYPPIAKEVCDALAMECQSEHDRQGSAPKFVFLVGGAGNGKSELAKDFLRQVKAQKLSPPSRFSERKYEFELESGRHLIVVNDATIPPESGSQDGPLASEISSAVSDKSHLLACVNRGVLIGEAKQASSEENLSSALISWLLSPDGSKLECCDPDLQAVCSDKGYYRYARIDLGRTVVATVHVVYMDYFSLVEIRNGSITGADGLSDCLDAPKLSLSPILGRDHENGVAATFASPLAKAAANFTRGTQARDLDPVLANAQVLAKDEAASALCSVFRGAEIRAGSHFTYRELWALFGHSIIGPAAPESLPRLEEWVSEKVSDAAANSGKVRLEALISLGNLRTHMLLFDGGKATGHRGPGDLFGWAATESDALNAIRSMDPLKDFGPSGGAEYNLLLDQVAGIEDGRMPSASILSNWPGFALHWTDFDKALEEAISEAIDPSTAKSNLQYRNSVLSWFGKYMFRLVALARGWPAHCSLVDRWQKAWNRAARSGRLAPDVERPILSIILPEVGQSPDTFFPILRSRVDGIHEGQTSVAIGIPRNHFTIQAMTRGDTIILNIEQGRDRENAAAETILDFHLLREALARMGNIGFTDSLSVIEPRLERIRASLLAHKMGSQARDQNYRITYRGGDMEIFA